MDRYAACRGVARDLSVDALALVPGPNFTRLLGKAFISLERPFLIVVPVEGPPAAVVPNLELGSFDLVGFEGKVFDWRDQDGYAGAFAALAAHLPLTRLAVEGQVMRVFIAKALEAAYRELEIVDGEAAIAGLRISKSPEEVAALEKAIAISEGALAEVLDGVRVGESEKSVERRLVQALFAHGADGLSFPALVAAGDNSARPHARAREDYKLKPGDALLLDFGAVADGFCADVTRTVFVAEVSDEGEAVYKTVLAANRKGREVAAPGVTAHAVDDAVTSILEASPFAERIRTKTGHGLGREVHEAPYIVRGNHTVLKPGMVFTDEPGLYLIGGFGVRIEDDILITETGCRSLTTFGRDLMIVAT